MKTQKNLLEKITSLDNLFLAYKEAKKHKKNRAEVLRYELNLLENLENLQKDLRSDNYKCDKYHEFMIFERKKRVIYAPSFRDLVAQHAIYKILYPIINAKLIHYSFGCRKGKGIHHTRDYVAKKLSALRQGYYLQCDIRKYFYSLDLEILERKLSKIIKKKQLLRLIMQFSKVKSDSKVGVPLGNLISQLFGLLYLNDLDSYAKRAINAQGYIRYVDDFLLFFNTKREAREAKINIESFLKTQNLTLSKVKIAPFFNGIKIVGFYVFKFKSLVEKRNFTAFKRSLKNSNFKSAFCQLALSINTQSQAIYTTLTRREYEKILQNTRD